MAYLSSKCALCTWRVFKNLLQDREKKEFLYRNVFLNVKTPKKILLAWGKGKRKPLSNVLKYW